MASLTTHCIVAASLALPALASRRFQQVLPGWRLLLGLCVLTAAPDLDLAGRRLFGIPQDSLLSHRGLFHSPFFLIVCAAAVAVIIVRRHSRSTFVAFWLLLAGCMVTHPLLDALTDGGRGIMLLLPISRARLFFPWHPIHTPATGLEPLFWRAFLIRQSEVLFCLAAMSGGTLGLLLCKRRWLQRQAAAIRLGGKSELGL